MFLTILLCFLAVVMSCTALYIDIVLQSPRGQDHSRALVVLAVAILICISSIYSMSINK